MDFFGITPSSQHISPLLLTCYICKRIYTRPKILSCYHTFCEACLLKSFPSQGLSLHCVICGHQSVLPKGGVGELEANPYVERIMKRVTEDTRPVTDTQRSNIPDVSELHANLAMETTVAADNRNTINETNIAFRCSLRCNNPVAMYCKSCDMVVCDNCAKIEHVEHFEKIITLEVMSKECEESLLKQAHTLERKMSPLHETSTEINRVTAELVSNRDTAIQTVNEAFDELESTLSRRRGELLQKIESTFAEKHSLLKSQSDELKSFTDKMEEGLDVIIQSMSCEDESFDSDMKTMNEGSDRIPDNAAFFLHKQISRTIDDLSKYKTENFEEELKKEVCGTVHSSDHGSNHIVEEIPDKFTIPCENSHIALENLQNVNKIRHMISTVGTVETSAAVAQKSVISGECLTTGVCKIDHENTILLTAKTSSGELETSGKVLATVDVKCLGPIPDNVVCSSPSDSSNSSGKRLLKSSRRPQSGVRLSTPSPGFKTTPTRRDTPSSPGSTLNRSPLKDIFFYTHAENSQPGGEREQTVVTEPTVTIDYIKHGTYEVTFIPRVEGQYKLSVKLYGQDIPQGSFLVSAVHKHGGMRVRSPSKSDKVILRPQSVRQKGMKRPPSVGPSKNPIEDDLVQRVGGRGRGKGEFSNPQGLALDNLGRLLVADSTNQCIQVFSITGRKREPKYLFKFGERGRGSGQVQRPTGVYVLPNGDIAVSDYDNKVVKIFGEDGTSKSIIGNGKLMGPKGLCVNRNGHLVVVDNKLCQIFLFQMNGKLVTKFGSRGTEPHQLAGPHFVSVNSENSIYVSDFYNHCVKVFTPRGDFLSVIGSSGEGCGQFNAPTGLAIDSRGNMIVADWGNSRLQVFDKFGSFLSYINTDEDPLYGPQGVTLTQDEKVAVADSGNHCVKIYRYLQ